MKSDEISVLLVDHHGDLWIGTHGGGLSVLSQGVFKNLTNQLGLANDLISALYEDSRGDLWIGTDGGGLNRLQLLIALRPLPGKTVWPITPCSPYVKTAKVASGLEERMRA